MDEEIIKNIVKKMFASGELEVGLSVSEIDANEMRVTVFVSDECENEILQSASIFIKRT